MPIEVNILVVEDDENQLETYIDTANELSDNEFKINLLKFTSASKAREALSSSEFDGAIVDLNLSDGNPTEASGNQVLLEILESHRFPIIVVSGNLAMLDYQVQQKRSGFLKTYDRTTDNSVIFGALLEIYKTGITKILGGRGQVDQLLGNIFWRHLACDFENWNDRSEDPERTLLRYTVAHLIEYLDIPEGKDKHYHDAEFYIRPPIREHIATGDIVEKDGLRYVVLSPACDVVVRDMQNSVPLINSSRIILAPLIDVSRDAFLYRGIIKEDDNGKTREKILHDIISGKVEKYAFVPEYGPLRASVIDFQNMHTWTMEEFLQAIRLSTISSLFLKNIQSKFSAYYGRQGQPDLDNKRICSDNKARLSRPEA